MFQPCDSVSSAARHSPAGSSAQENPPPPLHRSCHSHLWQAASLRRMLNLFHGSRRACSQESTPECFMSPSQWRKVMTRHGKLAGRGASQKRGPRDELWRLTERQRRRCTEGAVIVWILFQQLSDVFWAISCAPIGQCGLTNVGKCWFDRLWKWRTVRVKKLWCWTVGFGFNLQQAKYQLKA